MQVSGGDKFEAALAKIVEMLGRDATLRVGFLENATYPDGKSVGMIAAIQDMGAPNAGIPPRPFFRNMIAKQSSGWPAMLAGLLRANGNDVVRALNDLGKEVEEQIQDSIDETNSPPLKPATIARKGHAKALIDTVFMSNSVNHEVITRRPT